MLPNEYSKTPALKVAFFYSYLGIFGSAGVWLIHTQISYFIFSLFHISYSFLGPVD